MSNQNEEGAPPPNESTSDAQPGAVVSPQKPPPRHSSRSENKQPATSTTGAPPPNRPVIATAVEYDPWDHAAAVESGRVIINADPRFSYRYTPMKDYAPDGAAANEWRNGLAARKFEPCNGPRFVGESRGEYHVTEPTMEIWRRTRELDDEEFLAREVYPLLQRPEYADYYRAYPGEAGREPTLPQKLRDAMYALHSKNGKPKPTLAQLARMVRKLVKVHPGKAIADDGWDV